MSGDLRIIDGAGDAGPRTRPTGDSRSSSPTPLHQFVVAKSSICNVFDELQVLIEKSSGKLQAIKVGSTEVVSGEQVARLDELSASVATIREMLRRNHMKAVVFGRTSNGKSTCVNAMLHAKVLPQGIGHTTRCFIQVQGSDSTEKRIEIGKDRYQNIESIDEVAHALFATHEALGEDTIVKVHWPKHNSRLLQNDVVVLDSPGVDVSPDVDTWIDKHCLDADVFVLVTNAEATLTQAEKRFFYRVCEKLSKPTVFILNNRWDASAAEPDSQQKVREQHNAQFERFLVDELRVCTSLEASKRIYFVSAREVLIQRLRSQGIESPSSYLADGFLERCQAFDEFERNFESSISQSAIQAKFETHAQRGSEMVSSLTDMFEWIISAAELERTKFERAYAEKDEQRQRSVDGWKRVMADNAGESSALVDAVHAKAAADFADVTDRLASVIAAFPKRFADETPQLDDYRELVDFVEAAVTQKLTERCTGALLEGILSAERNLVAGATALLPPDYGPKVSMVMQYHEPFRFLVSIPFGVFVDDFQEDLTFRFSLGFRNLLRRVQRLTLSGAAQPALEDTSVWAFGAVAAEVCVQLKPADFSLTDQLALAKTLVAASTTSVLGIAAVGAVVVSRPPGCGGARGSVQAYRVVSWRIVWLGAAVVAGAYGYERLRWNVHAKEAEFKRQLGSHLHTKLDQFSRIYVVNCENQAAKHLRDISERVKSVSFGALQEIKNEADRQMENKLASDSVVKQVTQLRSEAGKLNTALSAFDCSHLSPLR